MEKVEGLVGRTGAEPVAMVGNHMVSYQVTKILYGISEQEMNQIKSKNGKNVHNWSRTEKQMVRVFKICPWMTKHPPPPPALDFDDICETEHCDINADPVKM